MSDGETHKKAGQQPHEPTDANRNKVKAYAAVGIPQQDIARVLRLSINTLRKYYIDELEMGSIEANAAIGGALYNKAKDGDTTAMIWWTKSRMRWSEKHEHELSGQIETKPSDAMVEMMARIEGKLGG